MSEISDLPAVPEVPHQMVENLASILPVIPGIDQMLSGVIMAIMPMIMGGTTCQCDLCQTMMGIFAGLQAQ